MKHKLERKAIEKALEKIKGEIRGVGSRRAKKTIDKIKKELLKYFDGAK